MKPTFDQINTTFATTYNWSVSFLGDDSRFEKSGHTITGVKEELGNIIEKTWTIGHRVISIPHQVGQTTITIDFNDTGDLDFFKYLDNMYRSFSSSPNGVKSYDKNIKIINVVKYTQNGEIVSESNYHAYPYGTLVYSGSSEAQLLTGQATFRVVKREVFK